MRGQAVSLPQPQPTLHRKGFTCLEQIDCQDEPTLESVNGEEENEEKEDEKVVASEEALIHRLPEPYEQQYCFIAMKNGVIRRLLHALMRR